MSEKSSSEEVFNANVESDESWILLKSSASNMDVKSAKDEQPPPEQDNMKSEGSSVEVLANKDEDKIEKDNETENVQSVPIGTSDHPDGDLSDGISIISETEGVETRSPAIEYLIQETVTDEHAEDEEVEEEEEEEANTGIATKDGCDQSGFIVNRSLIPSLRPRRKLTPTSSKKRPRKVRETIEPRRDGISRMLMLGCALIAVAIVLPFFTGGRNAQEEVNKLEVLLDRFESIENHINSLSEDMSKMRQEFEHMRLNVKPPDERKETLTDANENIEPTETFTINDLFSGLSDIIDTVRENIVTSYDEGNLNVVEPTVSVEDPKIETPTPVVDESYKENAYQQRPPPPQYDNNQYKKEYNKNYKNENHKYPQKPNDHKEYNDQYKQKRNEEWRHDNGYKKDYNKNYNENQKYEKNYKDQSKRNDRKYHQNDKYNTEKYKGETNYDDRKNPENYKGDKDHDSDWYQNMMNHRQEHREKNNDNFKNEYNWYIKRGGERERVRDQDEKYHH